MRPTPVRTPLRDATRISATLAALMLLSSTLTGCLVAGYSSGGGWFIWPGSLGLLLIVAVVIFLMRR